MKQGLLDFLQSASNAVASQVTGPIDLINSGLGAVGVPVSRAPVGGEDWMKRKGLIAEVPQGPARVMGETAGLLGPLLMAAHAKGLLSILERNGMPLK